MIPVTLPDYVSLELSCTPLSPFYVRWTNIYGGTDYFMFEKRQTYKKKLTKTDTYEPYLQTIGKTTVLSKESVESVIVGVGGLDADTWDALTTIAYSKNIQYYIGHIDGNYSWHDIMIEKADFERVSDGQGTYSLEIEFIFPPFKMPI